jgi:transmembrane sensor
MSAPNASPEATPENLAEEAATWFVRMNDPAEARTHCAGFRHWLEQSPQHRTEYGRFQRLWGALDQLPGKAKARQQRAGMAVAAVFALALAAWQIPAVDAEKSTKIGETQHLVLADGSEIDLDGNTTLRVDYSLFSRRLVLEHGQAFIKVAPGLRPFVVAAGDGELRDIGTRFNVVNEHGRVNVAVSEGMVEVRQSSSSATRTLSGGQQLDYRPGSLGAPRPVLAQAAEGWTTGRWTFDNANLGEVVEQINRQHEQPVILADSRLADYRVSGVFDRQDRAGLLKAITTLHPVRLEETPQGTRLLRAR